MISTAQLRGLGVDKSGVDRRVRAGTLQRYVRSVYLVGPVLPPLGPEAAALLACPGGVLFGFTAAAIWGLAQRPDSVHVISATDKRNRPGLIAHRGTVEPGDVRRRHGLSLTSPFRTLTDLRGRTPAKAFRAMVWEASYERLITGVQARGLTGAEPVEAAHAGERELVHLIREAGLPTPQTNVRIAGFEVDLYWPDKRLAVELDGRRAHGHELAVDRDRRKEMALRQRGIDLIRVGGAQLADESFAVVASIAGALAAA